MQKYRSLLEFIFHIEYESMYNQRYLYFLVDIKSKQLCFSDYNIKEFRFVLECKSLSKVLCCESTFLN